MSDWTTVSLAELVRFVNGDRGKNYPSAQHRVSSGVPFINAGHLEGGRVRMSGMDYITAERFDLLRSGKVAADDILLCIRGSIGRWAMVTPEAVPGAIASSLVILRSGPNILPGFLAAYLDGPEGRRAIAASDNGAAQPNIGAKDVARFEIQLPSLAEQAKIVGILGGLDDLIETNRRRVDVLEEMARAIYREWFVRFRLPGHENVELVDSDLGPIPEGWELRTVGDVLELRYGKALKADARAGGGVAVVGSSGIVGWHDHELVSGPAIVVGRKGNLGSVVWVDGPCWPIDTTYFVVTDLPLRFVAEQLRRTKFLNTHAAVPGLSREQAYSKAFLQPPEGVLDEFQSVADSLARDASSLMAQNDRLTSMRDLLLPKLVTGQIKASSLALDALVEGAVA